MFSPSVNSWHNFLVSADLLNIQLPIIRDPEYERPIRLNQTGESTRILSTNPLKLILLQWLHANRVTSVRVLKFAKNSFLYIGPMLLKIV